MGSMVRVGAARLSAGGDDHESGLLEDVEDVARLYVEEAARVRRLVRTNVTAPSAVIEDARGCGVTRHGPGSYVSRSVRRSSRCIVNVASRRWRR